MGVDWGTGSKKEGTFVRFKSLLLGNNKLHIIKSHIVYSL